METMVIIKIADDNLNKKVTKHFTVRELMCKCGQCHILMLNKQLLEKLETLRYKFNAPIILTSVYRCPGHNSNVGGVPYSHHTIGLACDLLYNKQLADLAKKVFDYVQVNKERGYIHCQLNLKYLPLPVLDYAGSADSLADQPLSV